MNPPKLAETESGSDDRLTEGTGRFFIITGGPGSGKSALISELAAQGFSSMPEAGRAIIQDQVLIGGRALPWADRQAFAELMLSWELRSYREAADLDGPVFFDRGLPDVVGYLRLCGLEVPEPTLRAARIFRYDRRVFLAPPWPEIYCRDEERRQSWEEAVATAQAMVEIYSSLGYEICPLPLTSVKNRAAFILSRSSSRTLDEENST